MFFRVIQVSKMDEGKKESHLISPVAFVEGGIQEACEDSCSICLEAFCDNDPGTVLIIFLVCYYLQFSFYKQCCELVAIHCNLCILGN